MRLLKFEHCPRDRALNFSVVFNIHLNLDYESYGGTESIRCMIDDKILYHSATSDVISFLCGMHRMALSILSLLKSENIDFSDEEKAVKSLSSTVRPRQNIDFYIEYIKPVGGEIDI